MERTERNGWRRILCQLISKKGCQTDHSPYYLSTVDQSIMMPFQVIEHLLSPYSSSFLGTTAESQRLLTMRSWNSAAVQKVIMDMPLITGVGTPTIRDSIEFAKEVAKFGGFAAVYRALLQQAITEGMYQHFKPLRMLLICQLSSTTSWSLLVVGNGSWYHASFGGTSKYHGVKMCQPCKYGPTLLSTQTWEDFLVLYW